MRILLILGPFFLAIGGLVYLQTGLFAPEGDEEFLHLGAVQVELSGVTDVIARLPASAQTPRAQAPILPDDGSSEMQMLTSAVLANLGVLTAPSPAEPAVTPEPPSELRTLTSSILANISGGTIQAPAPTQLDMSLEGVVTRAAAQGPTTDYAAMLSASAGRAVVIANTPTSFVTADGRVDASTILTSIAPVRARAPAQLTAEALAQTTLGSDGRRYYTIAEGDSLANLAQRFYGNASEAGRIFEANTDRLASPNLIRFGQKLFIPG